MKLKEILSQLQETQKKIGASPAYITGGTPRDRYMRHLERISDMDITNGDKSISYLGTEFYNQLKKKYNSVEMKSFPDGHSTIFFSNLKLDMSSNFNAPNIVGILNKMGVSHPTEMQKEVYSRDFTCNSLLLSLDLKTLIDPTDRGFKDIDEKMIRTCLRPEITLTTNRNRVIRSIYLACKLQFQIDENIVKFVQNNPESVKISTEKSLNDKLSEAFDWDGDKASYYLTKMKLWNLVPVGEKMVPYYKKNIGGT